MPWISLLLTVLTFELNFCLWYCDWYSWCCFGRKLLVYPVLWLQLLVLHSFSYFMFHVVSSCFFVFLLSGKWDCGIFILVFMESNHSFKSLPNKYSERGDISFVKGRIFGSKIFDKYFLLILSLLCFSFLSRSNFLAGLALYQKPLFRIFFTLRSLFLSLEFIVSN